MKHYSRMKSKDAPLRREGSEISFHSLRHSAVTMLKAADVSDFIAREVIGHESEAISRQYSHLTTEPQAGSYAQSAGRHAKLITEFSLVAQLGVG